MIHAYRYRLYPNAEQKAYFARCFGATRYAYNYYVREHERLYNETGKTPTGFTLMASMCKYKQDIPWLDKSDSVMLSYAALRVADGWSRFFDKTNACPPHEHKKGERPYHSYTTAGAGLKVYFWRNAVRLPIVGEIRARLHRRFFGEIKCATVKQTATGDYYVSLYVDERKAPVPMKPFSMERAVGIDVGVRHFLTLSDGTHIEMPDTSRPEHRRAFLQRRLKQQQPGSKGYQKTKRQIAIISEHISNIRLDFHHKTAHDICSRYDAVCMETLCVKGMRQGVGKKKDVKTTAFNRKLSHVGLGQFSQILESTAAKTGTHFTRIDRWEPSTKTCHVCGHVLGSISLEVSEWTCPVCGTHHDRDVNAAINIRDHAREQQPPVQIEEIPLDLNKIKKQLPTAGGKVKPAKANSPRTGKMTDYGACRPSPQIGGGSARPRLASDNPLPFLKISPFAKKYGMSERTIHDWLKNGKYKNIRYWQAEEYNIFFDALLDLAKSCRKTRICATERLVVSKQLGEMNKLVNIGSIIVEVFCLDITFTWWRQTKRTKEEIDVVNRIYSQDIPERIEKFVERYRPS